MALLNSYSFHNPKLVKEFVDYLKAERILIPETSDKENYEKKKSKEEEFWQSVEI